LDVGKGDHNAVGLSPDGKRLHDAPLPNADARLRQLLRKLARHGRSWSWSTSPPQSAPCGWRSPAPAGIRSPTYLPGLAMRLIADLCPGAVKTTLVTLRDR